MKQRIVFTIIMSFFLSSLMTLWITYINLGATIGFVSLMRAAKIRDSDCDK